ncbi:MAG: type II toxin-antitoxin system RelE/ParE family toxin [Actinomycetota bacterium]|nr:type II toxin-antitoxin system RelE/ParE family toxin [Actinomycetota bacterium]
MTARYRLRIAGPAAKALAEVLPEKVAAAAYEFITGPLLDSPRRVGKPLDPPLAPGWSARRGTYRILYRIDDTSHTVSHTVSVTAIRHRADGYHT